MNQELYHKVEKYAYKIKWFCDFDKYLIHLNLGVDIHHKELNVLLYKYYLYIMVEI